MSAHPMSRADTVVQGREEEAAFNRFRAWIDDDSFVCVGARSALHRGQCTFRLYDALASEASTRQVARDLLDFAGSVGRADEFITFVAAFQRPSVLDEAEFETLLWRQLGLLHKVDRSPWDPAVNADPADRRFSFSFGGRAYFVVGLHPGSSRISRRFAYPALAFNPRGQFEQLRTEGRFAQLQRAIRGRDLRLQGDINPMVSDFGDGSEARQYSGRASEDSWRCPFERGRS